MEENLLCDMAPEVSLTVAHEIPGRGCIPSEVCPVPCEGVNYQDTSVGPLLVTVQGYVTGANSCGLGHLLMQSGPQGKTYRA